jgi:hypothetical protein
MAAKSKQPFDYVAHVQKDGRVLELAGTREDWSMKHVRQWLWERAQEIGGWLLNDTVAEADESRCTYNEKDSKAVEKAGEVPETIQRLGASEGWMVYKRRYTRASEYVGRKVNHG